MVLIPGLLFPATDGVTQTAQAEKARDGRKRYEGPKRGRYYDNSHGNKTYVPKDEK